MCNLYQKAVEGCVGRCFECWGRFLVQRALIVIIVGSLLFIPWVIGWIATPQYPDQLRAWAMIGAEGTKNRETIDNTEFVNFDTATFIMRAKNDSNILNRAFYQRALDFHHYVLSYNNNRMLDTDCLKRGRCIYAGNPADLVEDATGNTSYLAVNVTSEAFFLGLVNTAINPNLGSDVGIATIFGGTTPTTLAFNSTSKMYNLREARAIKLGYFLNQNQQISNFIDQLVQDWLNRSENQDIQIVASTTKIYTDNLNDSVTNDIYTLYIGIVLFVLYGFFFFGTCHPVGCKCHLALIGTLCSVVGYLASYGFCSVCGLKVSDIHLLLPFLLLSIGADNIYVISMASDQINPTLNIRDKMAKTMRLGGSSVFITSLAQSAAFLVSSSSKFPAVRSFAIYAGVGVIFVFGLQITLFSLFLACDLQRQRKQNREIWGMLCCCLKNTTPRDQFKDQKVIKEMSTSGVKLQLHTDGQKDNNGGNNDAAQIQVDIEVDKEHKPSQSKEKKQQIDDTLYLRGSHIQRCLTYSFAKFVTHPVSVIIILIVFAGLTAFAGWGSTQVETEFNVDLILKDGHRLERYDEFYDLYFPNTGSTIAYFTDQSIDVSTTTNQESYLQVLNVLKGTTNCTHCDQNWVLNGTLSSWYLNFRSFANVICGFCPSNATCLAVEPIPTTIFKPCLSGFLTSSGAPFVNTTVFYDTSTLQIKTTISIFTQLKVANSNTGVKEMKQIRQIAKDYGISGSFMYAPEYQILEHKDGFDWEQIVTVISAIVIFCIIFLLSGSIVTSLIVFANLILISYNIFALLWYMNLELNLVTMANIILTFGLAFDYSEHIAQGYNISVATPESNTNCQRRRSKIIGAFSKLGAPVFHGAISTFIGIIPIAFANNYSLKAFFRQWFGIIFFGMIHGFFLLPALLSIFGCLTDEDKRNHLKSKDKS